MPRDDRLLVTATTAAGIVLAAALTLLLPSVYRADASIALVRQGKPPGNDPLLAASAAATAELLHSRAVAQSAVANLRLDESPDELLDRVEIETERQSSLVRLVVEAPTARQARRTAQELAEVSTVLFNERFGPETSATIWEPARAEEGRVSPKPARNLALGALLGALAGWALAASGWTGRRPPVRRTPAVPRPQAPDVAPSRAPAPAAQAEPALQPGRVAMPVPARAPAPGPFRQPRLGEWTVYDVERLLAEQGPAFPDRADELRAYLESFRDVASPDGRLPGGVEAVMEEAFRDLIQRAARG
jgi:capsular polysaccharide biosynthesis protein